MTGVQILHKAIFISHSANTFGEHMNPSIFFSAMGTLGSLILAWQPVEEKENGEFKSDEFCSYDHTRSWNKSCMGLLIKKKNNSNHVIV